MQSNDRDLGGGAALRSLIAQRSAFLAPGVYDGLSAALIADRFPAAYMSGAAVAGSYGLPDIGLATQSELLARVDLLTRSLQVPLIADADTGFGDVTHAYRTVRLYEKAGAAAIQMEDQEFPKRCGHLDEKRVIPTEEFVGKIEAAVAARRNPDTVVIARTDARATQGFDGAVTRLNRYAEAGADVVFLEAPQTLEEITELPKLVPVPAMFNFVVKGKTPPVALSQLRDAGYGLVILPGLTYNNAFAGMREAIARAERGDLDHEPDLPPQAVFEAVGLREWEAIRDRFDGPGVASDGTRGLVDA